MYVTSMIVTHNVIWTIPPHSWCHIRQSHLCWFVQMSSIPTKIPIRSNKDSFASVDGSCWLCLVQYSSVCRWSGFTMNAMTKLFLKDTDTLVLKGHDYPAGCVHMRKRWPAIVWITSKGNNRDIKWTSHKRYPKITKCYRTYVKEDLSLGAIDRPFASIVQRASTREIKQCFFMSSKTLYYFIWRINISQIHPLIALNEE